MSPDEGGSRVVIDIGNSRLKWARLDHAGAIGPTQAVDLNESGRWIESLLRIPPLSGADLAIASVNPPALERLARIFGSIRAVPTTIFTSAADVPIANGLAEPARAGVDRALAALAAVRLFQPTRPGLVVSCGTAITVERIDPRGVWEGGAIAAGLPLAARALHRDTAQLPLVRPEGDVPPWGNATESALAAGVWWGTVGAVRELIARQGDRAWIVWTGGDAESLAAAVSGGSLLGVRRLAAALGRRRGLRPAPRRPFPLRDISLRIKAAASRRTPKRGGDARSTPLIVPDLVLRGLAVAAFGIAPQALRP